MRRLLCLCVFLSGCVGVVESSNGSVDEQTDSNATEDGDDANNGGDPAGVGDPTGGGDPTSGGDPTGGGDPDGGDPEVPPIPVVADCDALGEPGTWERIGPPTSFEEGSFAVSSALDPNHVGTVYFGTFMDGLWKTEDCGASWVKINTGLNSDKLDSGWLWDLMVDPINSDLYATAGYGGNGLYRSTNGGVDFDDITPRAPGIPTFVQGFAIDPTDHRHILVGFHNNCTGAYAPMCFAESFDGAATWTFHIGPAGHWEEGAGPMLVNHDTWLYGSPSGLYVTIDGGTSWEKPIPYPGCSGGYIIAEGYYYIGCLDGIFRSADARTWVKVENSKRATAVVQVGGMLYSAYQDDLSGQPLWRAPVTSPTEWSQVTTPHMSQGASSSNVTYDAVHKVMYFPGWSAGLWRAVVE